MKSEAGQHTLADLVHVDAGDLLHHCDPGADRGANRAAGQGTHDDRANRAQGLGDLVAGHGAVDCADHRQVLQGVQRREHLTERHMVLGRYRRCSLWCSSVRLDCDDVKHGGSG
jgi:hypothetical protein